MRGAKRGMDLKRKGSKVRIELKESEKMGIERENERERLGKKKSNEFEKKKWLKKRESVCVSVFLPAGVQRLVSTLLQHYCIINQVLFSYPLLFRYSVLLFRHCFSYGPYFFSIALSLTDAHTTGFALPLLRSSISTLCELPFMQWSHTVYCQGCKCCNIWWSAFYLSFLIISPLSSLLVLYLLLKLHRFRWMFFLLYMQHAQLKVVPKSWQWVSCALIYTVFKTVKSQANPAPAGLCLSGLK